MMMERKFIGLCAIAISALASQTYATPVAEPAVLDVLKSASHDWSASLNRRSVSVLDDQIFTDLSPILNSPDAIKLPEDQQLAPTHETPQASEQ